MGRYYKLEDGTRVQVVGIAEDGKYNRLTEDPQPAMFLPFLQSSSSLNDTWSSARAAIRSQLARGHQEHAARPGCRAAF